MKLTNKTTIIFILIGLLINSIFAQKKEITVEDIWLNYTFYPRSIHGLKSSNDGIHYTMLKDGGIVKCSYTTGEVIDTIVKESDLIPPNDENPINITKYQFSKDESRLLIYTKEKPIYRHSFSAENYVFDIKNKKLIAVSKDKRQQLASLSSDGSKVAYVRKNNIYLFDLEKQEEKPLTEDGEINKIINGAPDWVYEEEFSFARGFHWSPDGKKIAFYRFDESQVKEFSMIRWGKLYPELYQFKYPKTGDDNSIVTIHVYDIESQTTKEMDIGHEKDQYIPRIKWTNDPNVLCITRLNRLQNKLELLLADVNTGESNVLLTEKNKYYIEITDNLTFLKDNKHFIWTSEMDGYNHIYLYDMKGKLNNQITKGKWDMTSFKGVDEENQIVYYISVETSPLEKDLYSIKLDGSKKRKLSNIKGTNDAKFSKTYKYYINYFSDANTPSFITLHNSKGKQIGDPLEDNSLVKERLGEYMISTKEFFKFTTSENIELNGWMIKPVDFDPNKKYPVFMTVYGGPNANTVTNSWNYNVLWHKLIAQKGYIVVSVDNRGTGLRGEEFRKCTYQQLGKLETIDLIEAAKWLGALPYVDEDRIGIQGWSYGGYMSILCILKGADVFKMAIAVAPVTNWRYYDNIYTERYMRTPQENPDGYDDNSPINFVDNLKGKFLLIHGGNDDNVHLQNTMELVEALNTANKQFDMHIYPYKNHSIYGGKTRLHLYKKMTNYILENL